MRVSGASLAEFKGGSVMNQVCESKAAGVRVSPGSRSSVQALSARLVKAADTLLLWRKRARDRRLLAELDDRLLGDIGISRGDAIYEMDKPFWRR
jgi:uncharacterized protein YjiS (DUF1127 family)